LKNYVNATQLIIFPARIFERWHDEIRK